MRRPGLSGLKGPLEGAPAQDLGLDLNLGLESERSGNEDSTRQAGADLQFQARTELQRTQINRTEPYGTELYRTELRPLSELDIRRMSAKELAVARELRVGQGPVCGPRGVKPEVLERDRLRELERALARARSR